MPKPKEKLTMNLSTKTVKGLLLAVGSALLLALTSSCTTLPRPSLIPALRQHPEYEDAMRSAPNFTTAAMKSISDLEAAAAKHVK